MGFFIKGSWATELKARYFWDWVCQNTNVHLSNESSSHHCSIATALPASAPNFLCLCEVILDAPPPFPFPAAQCLQRWHTFCRLCPPKISMRIPHWLHKWNGQLSHAHPCRRLQVLLRLMSPMPRNAPQTNQPATNPLGLLIIAPIPAPLYFFLACPFSLRFSHPVSQSVLFARSTAKLLRPPKPWPPGFSPRARAPLPAPRRCAPSPPRPRGSTLSWRLFPRGGLSAR